MFEDYRFPDEPADRIFLPDYEPYRPWTQPWSPHWPDWRRLPDEVKRKPKKNDLLARYPRPGAMLLAGLADYLFNHGRGDLFENFMNAFSNARQTAQQPTAVDDSTPN